MPLECKAILQEGWLQKKQTLENVKALRFGVSQKRVGLIMLSLSKILWALEVPPPINMLFNACWIHSVLWWNFLCQWNHWRV